MSLPPSATPRSVPPKEETYSVNMDTTSHHLHHHHPYPTTASKITTTMGPPPSVASYNPSPMAPATPLSAGNTAFTPRGADATNLQPSLQYECLVVLFDRIEILFFFRKEISSRQSISDVNWI